MTSCLLRIQMVRVKKGAVMVLNRSSCKYHLFKKSTIRLPCFIVVSTPNARQVNPIHMARRFDPGQAENGRRNVNIKCNLVSLLLRGNFRPANIERNFDIKLVGRWLSLDHAELADVIAVIGCEEKVSVVHQAKVVHGVNHCVNRVVDGEQRLNERGLDLTGVVPDRMSTAATPHGVKAKNHNEPTRCKY